MILTNFFKILFERMESYNLDYDQDMIHRRIEIYLEEGQINKTKIIEMIKDQKYFGKYDPQYLLMLFKNKNFTEGVDALIEFLQYNKELLKDYMNKKEYEKIINLCQKCGAKDTSFWWKSLDYFVNKEIRKELKDEEINELNKYLQDFLLKLLDSGTMLSVDILDIINKKNSDFPLEILNDFINKSLDKEINSIEEHKKNLMNIILKLMILIKK